EEADAGALLAVDRDVDEGGDADQVDAAGGDVAPGDGDRLDGLVDGSGADRLDLDLVRAPDDTGDRSGDGDRLGRCRDLEDFHGGGPPPARRCENAGAVSVARAGFSESRASKSTRQGGSSYLAYST